ncbi:MAG: hypothetical protein AUG74_10675 [Bacteroidetes bacterium 13_1_20CM_4_60_6]|nr:MAG: hypothetical protein AUG74_10675 [Bacteroidetes bacterium 13_1_20CM_4_60_6]
MSRCIPKEKQPQSSQSTQSVLSRRHAAFAFVPVALNRGFAVTLRREGKQPQSSQSTESVLSRRHAAFAFAPSR